MPATLRSLLDQPDFHLHPLAALGPESAALDAPVTWVHSSDLIDPTPWLEEGQILLTDGVHFTAESTDAFSADYVQRLRARGILALGFATRIAHDTVPEALVNACETFALPLFEVADRTPFMSIIRHVADVTAHERQARLEWSLQAQRALARAALRPDGLEGILIELERQLGSWVALYDSIGARVRVRTTIDMPEESVHAVEDAVRTALGRGTRSGGRLSVQGGDITVQTLGRRDRLRGVLAVGAAVPLDAAGNDLVASVIALASIALEQRRTLDAARRQLRSGLLELLLSGVIDVAGRTARRLGGPLPAEPLRVWLLAGALHGQSLIDELELHQERSDGRLFFAERDEEIVLVTAHNGAPEVEALLARNERGAGISAPVTWGELSRGLSEARRSVAYCSEGRPLVRFDSLAAEGMLGLLEASGGNSMAQRVLQPLLDRPTAEREVLLNTARVWLEQNCAWDPTAKALGAHRHTVRNRISAIESVLGLDLETFAGRAELWSALHFV
ncbi:PucR family transcriptional regulator ligand-binding domain-containing protein [Microbacteriaceae bacterium VKM Ac-2855]|nr:PucR family transcriptional regulator ligand-binding domain-containing protein [Microbacteriaceae bacterium VKM Ac-2855]